MLGSARCCGRTCRPGVLPSTAVPAVCRTSGAARTATGSGLTIHGIVRHLTDVERGVSVADEGLRPDRLEACRLGAKSHPGVAGCDSYGPSSEVAKPRCHVDQFCARVGQSNVPDRGLEAAPPGRAPRRGSDQVGWRLSTCTHGQS